MVALLPRTNTAQTLAQAPIPQADLERKRVMADAWKAFRGEFVNPLKVKANQPDDNVLANRCEPIVEKGASFLFGPVLKIEAQNKGEEQAAIDELWGDDDDKMSLLSDECLNGGVCGHNFVKLMPSNEPGEPPRIVVLDPQIVRIVTSPEDSSCHLAYIIEYPGSIDLQKRQIIARVDLGANLDFLEEEGIASSWTITNYLRRGSSEMWQQFRAPIEWPYPFAPIIENKNRPNPNEAWGRPDLTHDLIQQNKVLQFVESNTSRIIKYHGHPITYATGLNASQISISVDELICLPSAESKLDKLAAMDNFPGLLAFAEVIRQNMDEQSRVPSIALGRLQELPRGNISGVALKLLLAPLMEKTQQKQRLYGRMVRDVTRASLVLMGKLTPEQYKTYKVKLHWQNLLPVDDLLAAQTAQILDAIGVSLETLLQELGYNPEDEAKKKAVEIQTKQSMLPPAMQAQPGQAPPPAQPQQQQGGMQ